MEFKGTKGEWTCRRMFEKPIEVIDEKEGIEWLSNTVNIHDKENRIIADVSYSSDTINQGYGRTNSNQRNEANAKLIAAAPELLEALQEIVNGNGAYDTDKLRHASNCIENMKSIAKQAINKALK